MTYYTPMVCDSGAAAWEFFAGGGMARLGLAPAWTVSFANDFDPDKARAYEAAFGPGVMRAGDVWALDPADVPGTAGLAWASFPCQDLSLAGARGGLKAARSGAFWGFWRLITALAQEGRAPGLIALENVLGLASSHGGADFAALMSAGVELGYRVGAAALDAAWFTPQSRPRLFIVMARGPIPAALIADAPDPVFHGRRLQAAVAACPALVRERLVWWRLPAPPRRNMDLAALIDRDADGWLAPEATERLLDLMAPGQRAVVERLRAAPARTVGTAFRRMRGEAGRTVQRLEARFDGVAGCLRTPAGGSSRQLVLELEAGRVRARLMRPREAARLMGLPEEHPLPENATQALHFLGDGVATPVVRWLSQVLLEPLHAARSPARGADEGAKVSP